MASSQRVTSLEISQRSGTAIKGARTASSAAASDFRRHESFRWICVLRGCCGRGRPRSFRHVRGGLEDLSSGRTDIRSRNRARGLNYNALQPAPRGRKLSSDSWLPRVDGLLVRERTIHAVGWKLVRELVVVLQFLLQPVKFGFQFRHDASAVRDRCRCCAARPDRSAGRTIPTDPSSSNRSACACRVRTP